MRGGGGELPGGDGVAVAGGPGTDPGLLEALLGVRSFEADRGRPESRENVSGKPAAPGTAVAVAQPWRFPGRPESANRHRTDGQRTAGARFATDAADQSV